MRHGARIFLMVLLDIIFINLALWLAFMMRWNWEWNAHALHGYTRVVPVVTLLRLIIFQLHGLYSWSFRYAGFSDGFRILRAVFIGSLILIFLVFLTDYRRYIGRTIPIVEFIFCSFFTTGFRFLFRLKLQVNWSKPKALTRVVIVGAGTTGAMVARELMAATPREYLPVGFIDDNPAKIGQHIHNLKVLGNRSVLPRVVADYRVGQIIMALPNAPGKIIRELILSCQQGNVKFKIVPGLSKILTGKVELKPVREVKPEDLLGRQVTPTDDSDIREYIDDQVILITGAGGSIGSELVRQLIHFNPQSIVLCDHYENEVYFLELELMRQFPGIKIHTMIGDIMDVALLKYIFTTFHPKVVFHAAAHKHVPLMENNPAAAVKNNIIATRNLIYAAEHYNVNRFVLISTDKAVNPTNVMGATKRITEMLCQAKSKTGSRTKFMAVRFGNVLGSNGSVVQIFKKQIEAGGPITITDPEIRRYFMTVSEAAQLVLQAGGLGNGGEIFILDMGEQVKIVDLAKNMIALSGLDDRDIAIQFTGLRPGEKLYEEMLHDAESDMSTKHHQIYVAQPDQFDIRELRRDIESLRQMANLMNQEDILEKLKLMVPSFHHATNKE